MCRSCPKVLLFAVLLFQGLVQAQTGANSPYSRFGLGDPVDQNFAALRSMGGISAAFSHQFYTNLSNPASLGALQATSFEIGFDASRSNLSTDAGQSEITWGGNMTYFSLAFPLINPVNRLLDRKSSDFNWGMSLSLLPNTRVGHFTSAREDLSDIGTVDRQYQGTGGTNQFIWGNGFKYKQFYGGLSLGYLFGSIKDEKAVLFEDVRLAFHDYGLRNSSYRGFSWKAGLQYVVDLSKGEGAKDERNAESITFGLSGNSRWGFRSISTVLDARMENSYIGLFEAPVTIHEVDTLVYQEDLRSDGKYPGEFSLGVIYKKSTKWILGINYRTSGWASYQNDLQSDQQFANASQFSIGGQFIPDALAYKYYYQRIRYRAGLRFGTDPRVIDGNQIKDLGVSVGFGLPIVLSRDISFINLGVEFGKHSGQIPIKENFIRFNVGVTLNNNLWFLKRKFN